MKHLSLVGRSRTVLLVVIGVLLVPTIALGARLVSGWQSGAVVVRKTGPLPTVQGVFTDADWAGDEYYLRVPVPIAAPPLGGAIESSIALEGRMVVPTDLAEAASDILGDHVGEPVTCQVSATLVISSDVFYGSLIGLTATTSSQALAWAGTHPFTASGFLRAPAAAKLPEAEIEFYLDCWHRDSGGIEFDLGTSPIALTFTSVRVLGF